MLLKTELYKQTYRTLGDLVNEAVCVKSIKYLVGKTNKQECIFAYIVYNDRKQCSITHSTR